MLDAEELAEMRVLQARAYGRDEDPTDAEAARLQELQARRARRVTEPREAVVADASELQAVVADSPEFEDSELEAADIAVDIASDTAVVERVEGATNPSLLRTYWRHVSLAAAVVLVVGVGLGWLLFGQSRPDAVALTSEQQEWQNALLAEGIYDPGSVRAVGVEEGVVIWSATKDERERTCLILSDGETTSPTCELTESVSADGIYASIVVETHADSQREVSAQMLVTISGEPAVAVNAYDYDTGSSGIVYADERETSTAERLSESGFDANSIWVVGYDGPVPIWTAIQHESQRQCLIYDGSVDPIEMSCSDAPSLQADDSLLGLYRADASGSTTRYEMRTGFGPPYLVITHEGGELGAGGD